MIPRDPSLPHRILRLFVLILFLLPLSHVVHASQDSTVLSVDDAIRMSQKAYPDVLQAELEMKNAEIIVKAAVFDRQVTPVVESNERLVRARARYAKQQALDAAALNTLRSYYDLIVAKKVKSMQRIAVSYAKKSASFRQEQYGVGLVDRMAIKQAELSVKHAIQAFQDSTEKENTASLALLVALGSPLTAKIRIYEDIPPLKASPFSRAVTLVDLLANLDRYSPVRIGFLELEYKKAYKAAQVRSPVSKDAQEKSAFDEEKSSISLYQIRRAVQTNIIKIYMQAQTLQASIASSLAEIELAEATNNDFIEKQKIGIASLEDVQRTHLKMLQAECDYMRYVSQLRQLLMQQNNFVRVLVPALGDEISRSKVWYAHSNQALSGREP